MALSQSALAADIKANLLADDASQAQDNPALEALCQAIAKAVVERIVADAVVLPTELLAPPGTAGGPVTGTGSIT